MYIALDVYGPTPDAGVLYFGFTCMGQVYPPVTLLLYNVYSLLRYLKSSNLVFHQLPWLPSVSVQAESAKMRPVR
jgi:hypothetical protein